MSTAESFNVHVLAPGIDLCVRKDYEEENADEVYEIVTACRGVALGREGMLVRIRAAIEQLAKIDEACGGNDDGLVDLSESVGWLSNSTEHTTEDYRKAMLALVETLDDDDLPGVLSAAEENVALAAARTGGAA